MCIPYVIMYAYIIFNIYHAFGARMRWDSDCHQSSLQEGESEEQTDDETAEDADWAPMQRAAHGGSHSITQRLVRYGMWMNRPHGNSRKNTAIFSLVN